MRSYPGTDVWDKKNELRSPAPSELEERQALFQLIEVARKKLDVAEQVYAGLTATCDHLITYDVTINELRTIRGLRHGVIRRCGTCDKLVSLTDLEKDHVGSDNGEGS